MSLPKNLAERTLARITERFRLEERTSPEGGPLLTLKAQMGPGGPVNVGWVRELRGGPLGKVINVGIVVPPIGLDSHMIFAFTRDESPVPHFTIDSVGTGAFFAFHLDLIPRADLGANLAYMNAAFQPLTETFEATQKLEGLSPAKLSPRQNALMSPWMLAHRATEAAFSQIGTAVDTYLEHWFGLVERGLPAEVVEGLDGAALSRRDARQRAAIFSPEIDPVWNQVDRLVGPDVSATIRDLLKSPSGR
jgi:hypothetical protein